MTEMIPATEETTGITFHFAGPIQRRQTLLLVTYQTSGNWQWDDLGRHNTR